MSVPRSPVSVAKTGRIAVITVDNPPVNAISQPVRQALLAALRAVDADGEAAAAVLICAGKTFMAGSDIREFDAPIKDPPLNAVIAAVEDLRVPVVAALHGTALGGGFELAMGCAYRIAAPTAKVGLPEINLGLIPGAGGTQRLPRLIGAEAALDAILSGRHIGAAEALKLGAIDEIADGDLRAAAISAAERLATESKHRRTRDLAVPRPPAPEFFASQRAGMTRKFRGTPAPPCAVDAVEAAATLPFAEGLKREGEMSARLKASWESKALRHLFFGEREVARIPGIGSDTALRSVGRVGVVGAGTMGRGIALSFLNGGFSVVLVDTAQAALDRALAAIAQTYDRDVEKGRLSAEACADRLARLTGTTVMDAVGACELVIEAAFEDMAVKRRIFQALDSICAPGTILASNTSTLNLDEIAAVTKRPADVLGMHFFSPAHVMRLLEVVRGARTAPDALATVMAVAKRINKVAVVSGVCFGFIGNRMFEGYIRESQMLLLEGATPAQVDAALVEFGMAMGPCAVIDLAGVDVSYLTREGNRANLPADPRYCLIGDRLHHLGRHGQKTGQGFYRYANGKAEPDPEVEHLIRSEAQRLGIAPRTIGNEEIIARCIYPLISEGAQILDEGIALRAVDIDVVWCTGYGFPRYRGGPLFHADRIGPGTVVAGMARLADTLGNEFGYWTPAPLLERLARAGQRFADLGPRKA
jgi:3-hydroxyacyl-CoA dehydrogenase